jgi:hypothetical protein
MASREPPARLAQGLQRDPRIYFAAERTYLAWIRTGLGLMGFGFVVARFGLFLKELVITRPDLAIKSSGVLTLGRYRSDSGWSSCQRGFDVDVLSGNRAIEPRRDRCGPTFVDCNRYRDRARAHRSRDGHLSDSRAMTQ